MSVTPPLVESPFRVDDVGAGGRLIGITAKIYAVYGKSKSLFFVRLVD